MGPALPPLLPGTGKRPSTLALPSNSIEGNTTAAPVSICEPRRRAIPAGLSNAVEAESAREALPAKMVARPSALVSRIMNPEAAASPAASNASPQNAALLRSDFFIFPS
jgi:hypothetical protein